MKIKSLKDILRKLHSKNECREYLEGLRWQGIPKCPHCQSEKHYKLTIKGEFNGLYKCRECKERFTVTIGTMFEGSKVPLEDWFYAIYIFLSHKKGISSIQLSKDIGVTQKTAWFMLNRIRHNMNRKANFFFNDVTQVDETYIGGKNKNRFKRNQGRSLKQKTPVVGLLSHDKVYTIVVPNVSSRILKGVIYSLVVESTTVVTDGLRSYKGLDKHYNHQIVDHDAKKYVNEEGYHTNGIEGFWSQLERGLKGIYHVVSPKHLSKYYDEFAYRYNTRFMIDIERFTEFIATTCKRLSYYDLRYTKFREI